MKINKLEAHDRLLHFKKQSDYISEGCQECIRKAPEAYQGYPFYIFAHKREIDLDERIAMFNLDIQDSMTSPGFTRKYTILKDVPNARLIWEPVLNKPKVQENSMLFRVIPGTDNVAIMWIIPGRELWKQYEKGNVTEAREVVESIQMFKNNPAKLEADEPDEIPEQKKIQLMEQVRQEKIRRDKLRRATLAVS